MYIYNKNERYNFSYIWHYLNNKIKMNKLNINSKKDFIGYTSSITAAISYGISAILAKIIVGEITTPLIASVSI